jgi:EAL domain-containing protein (putative c-di-GMP-specific phosphodiesterase class I)
VQDKSIDQSDSDLSGGLAASRLKHALDNDEFELFCQPIMALGGTLHYPMAEVLIRLREEETAMLPPGEFLPVFEHYRMMPQLDRWVVRQVVRRLAKGSRVPCFTINVSAQTIEDAEFPAFFAAEMKAVPAGSVMFEINEADMMARAQAVARFMKAVKAAGGGAIMDSFGRKSVSFGPVKALAPDFVKVDGSIVRKLLKSEVARTKLSAVMRVGQSVPFGVIAECVEEQDVLLRLKAMGVGFAQGFGVHQPQPIDAIAEKS